MLKKYCNSLIRNSIINCTLKIRKYKRFRRGQIAMWIKNERYKSWTKLEPWKKYGSKWRNKKEIIRKWLGYI